ncbi:ORF03R [Marbled eel polyomavirus]|nr:ORF03R [Marbled eel polyomavirus]ANC70192.1 ORF03R [Marbled eel polyomavirus]
MEQQLHRRMVETQGLRSQQAPLGMSSGDDYTDTSDTTSEYYSPDSDDYCRGPSIDHIQLTTNPGGRGPLVLTVVHTPGPSRNQGTITQYIRLGTTETTVSPVYGVQTKFKPLQKHTASAYRYRVNRIRTLRHRIQAPKRSRRADAHRQHYSERIVEPPMLPHWPQQAFYKTDAGYDADIDCNPEPFSKRRRIFKPASVRSVDSCFLSTKADAGHFHQLKCALTPSMNLSDMHCDDTVTCPSEPEVSLHMRSHSNKHQTYSMSFRPHFRNYERIGNVTMTTHQYSVQLLKRIIAGNRSEDSESLWAGQSIHTDMSFPNVDPERDYVQRLLKHIRVEEMSGNVTVPKPEPSQYQKLLEETGVTGEVIDPSSVSEDEALMSCCIAPETIKAQYAEPRTRTQESTGTYRSGKSTSPLMLRRRQKRISRERMASVRTRLQDRFDEREGLTARVVDGLFEGITVQDRDVLENAIVMSFNHERLSRATNPFYRPEHVFYPVMRSEPGGFRSPQDIVSSGSSSSPAAVELPGGLSPASPNHSPASDMSELAMLFNNVAPPMQDTTPPRPVSRPHSPRPMSVNGSPVPRTPPPPQEPVQFQPRTLQVGGYVFQVSQSDSDGGLTADDESLESASTTFSDTDSVPQAPSFQTDAEESDAGYDLFRTPPRPPTDQ